MDFIAKSKTNNWNKSWSIFLSEQILKLIQMKKKKTHISRKATATTAMFGSAILFHISRIVITNKFGEKRRRRIKEKQNVTGKRGAEEQKSRSFVQMMKNFSSLVFGEIVKKMYCIEQSTLR